MEKKFVSYPIALLLKELGYDGEVCGLYRGLRLYPIMGFEKINSVKHSVIAAPLWQDIIDWLEEKHNIIVEILPAKDNKYTVAYYMKNMTSKEIYEFFHNAEVVQYTLYNTKLEAREAAVLVAIEPVKKGITG